MTAAVGKRLIVAGVVLFLIGLLTGFVIPAFENPRMGLSSHLEAVMNGAFLIALGAAWSFVRLSPGWEAAAYWLTIYGSFANWAFVSLAALFGTSEMTPIAGAGHSAPAVQEQIVSLGLVSVGIAMLAAVGIILYGLLSASDG